MNSSVEGNVRTVRKVELYLYRLLAAVGLGLVIAATVSRNIWLPFVAGPRHAVCMKLGSVVLDLRGHWLPWEVGDREYRFTRLVHGTAYVGASRLVLLQVVRYEVDNQAVQALAGAGTTTILDQELIVNNVRYKRAAPLRLDGHVAVGLYGLDDTRSYLRIDMPTERLALIFIVPRSGGHSFLDWIVRDSLPDLATKEGVRADSGDSCCGFRRSARSASTQ